MGRGRGLEARGWTESKFTAEVVRRYVEGQTIRQIGDEMGWSYGFIHKTLRASHAVIRSRGHRVKS